ncbi:MAG: glycosyltransferase family 2 protein [Bacillota bacterium]
MKLSIIIPIYNSEKTIGKVITKLHKYIDFKFEIICIDDGSKDKSVDILKELKKRYKNIKIVILEKNFGQQNAIFAGFNFVNGKNVITIDDDGQQDIKDILKIFDLLKKYDIVFGVEKDKSLGQNFRDLFFKKFFFKNGNLKVSSFRGFKNKFIKNILKTEYKFIYISALLLKEGQNIGNLIIKKKKRINGKSGYNLYKRIKLFINLVIYYAPFKFLEKFRKKEDSYLIKKVIK